MTTAAERLVLEPVIVFYTLGVKGDDSLYRQIGELLMSDETGVLVGSGIKPHRLTFIPAQRIVRIEAQS